jgi:hypothetical protein
MQDIRILSRSCENDMYALQMQWRNEISNLGMFFVICYTKVHSKFVLIRFFFAAKNLCRIWVKMFG